MRQRLRGVDWAYPAVLAFYLLVIIVFCYCATRPATMVVIVK